MDHTAATHSRLIPSVMRLLLRSRRRESNPHVRRHMFLRHARLPVTPLLDWCPSVDLNHHFAALKAVLSAVGVEGLGPTSWI